MSIDFNLLPILTNFRELRFGDKVYSKRFGIGEFLRLYQNEAVIKFSDRQIRIALDEQDISFVAKNTRKRGKNKIICETGGKKISFKKMKQAMVQDTMENFVLAKVAMDILSIRPKKFISLCNTHNIKINKFGIRKKDLLKLNSIIFSK